MATKPQAGGASALPIARAFIETGGKILINPTGKIETGGSFPWLVSDDARAARRGFIVARRFHRRLRNPSFARSVATLVAMEGERTGNGWLVMDGRP